MQLTAPDLGTFSDVAMPGAVDSCAWMGKDPRWNVIGEEGGEVMVSKIKLPPPVPACLSIFQPTCCCFCSTVVYAVCGGPFYGSKGAV